MLSENYVIKESGKDDPSIDDCIEHRIDVPKGFLNIEDITN